jgi:hypothetical protein
MGSEEAAFFQGQASGIRLLAREVANVGTHATLTEMAKEYEELSIDPRPWPPLAGGPRSAVDRSEQPATTEPVIERRRPGRVEYTNRALIELLRAPSEQADVRGEGADVLELSPAKGVLLGVALSASMWVAGLFLMQVVW